MKVKELPPAELTAEVLTPAGERFRWDPASRNVGQRPLDISFDTEAGEGFSSGSVTLRRAGNRLYDDLALLNELRLTTGGGRRVYEGRARGVPIGDAWQMDCEGWMSHARQRTFTDLLVERDFAQFGENTQARLAWLLGNGYTPNSGYTAQVADAINFIGETGRAIPYASFADLTYRAPAGCRVVKVMYRGAETNTSNVGPLRFAFMDEDGLSNGIEINPTMNGALQTMTPSDGRPQLILWFFATATHTPTLAHSRTISQLATYGSASLKTIPRENEPDGIAASDGIRFIANKYAPKLKTDGIQQTTYPIPNAVWRDPITVHEAAKQLNSYHGWQLAVWDERTLTFAPYDLSEADWQVRNGVDGVRVETPGDTTETVFNGCCVTYTDTSGGSRQRVTPLDAADLNDTSDAIAANQWGDQAWLDIEISWRCQKADAVQLGAIALVEANRARRPSTITVPMYLQDIDSHWQPSSLVRADQSIVVTNQHSPTPRKITRTSWQNHQLTITTDNAVDSQEAFNARMLGALNAAGLM
jgi:hypothetical protein